MRTTVDIDDDVLQVARELSRLRGATLGKVLSDLARNSLHPPTDRVELRNGVPVLAPRAGERLVTMEDVRRLRDDDEPGAGSP